MFEMERQTILAGIISVTLVLVVAGVSVETQFIETETTTYTADANITASLNNSDVKLNNSLGVDATTDRLAFGMMPVIDHDGLSSRRFFNISTEKPMLLRLSSSGNISEYLTYISPQYLEAGSHQIELVMSPHEQGWLEGNVTVTVETTRNGRIPTMIGERWLRTKQVLFSRF